nr:MAG TPA: hypothetical protein [Caudoviricetes sp.]
MQKGVLSTQLFQLRKKLLLILLRRRKLSDYL